MHELWRTIGRKEAGRSRLLVSDLATFEKFSDQELQEVKVVNGNIKNLDKLALSRRLFLLKKLKVLRLYEDDEGDVKDSEYSQDLWRELGWSAFQEILFLRLPWASTATMEAITRMESLRCLILIQSHVEQSGSFPGKRPVKFRNLQHFELRRYHFLRAISPEIRELETLRHLEIFDCSGLVAISAEIVDLQSLEFLGISGCKNTNAIPEEIGWLQNLQYLEISGCDALVLIAEEIGELRKLRSLEISWCSKLIQIPESIGRLTSLQRLHIESCGSLKVIPESIGHLGSLVSLEIFSYGELQVIPSTIGQLKNL